MSILKRLPDSLFSFVMGTLFSYALCLAVLSGTVIQLPLTPLLMQCALFMGIFSIVFFDYRIFLPLFGLFAVFVSVVFIMVKFRDAEYDWLIKLSEIFKNLVSVFRDKAPYKDEYDHIIALILPLGSTLIVALNLQLTFSFPLAAIIGLAAIAVPVQMQWGRSDTAIALFIFCFAVLMCKQLNLGALPRKEAAPTAKSSLLFSATLIPLGVLIAAVAWMLPKPESPPTVQRTPQEIAQSAEQLFSNMSPVKQLTFTEEGERMGGPNTLSPETVMYVASSEPLYLSASIRDTYTGTAWNRSDKSRDEIPQGGDGDFAITQYTGNLIDTQQYYMRYYDWRYKTAGITLADTRTKAVFAPPYSTILTPNSASERIYQDIYGCIETHDVQMANQSYSQSYISWNYSSGYFSNVLRDRPQLDTAVDGNMDRYLTLPSSLPHRVVALAEEITAGYSNNYDKISALTDYLHQFPYTLEPDSLPAGEDFVDYFLFTGKEGYCVYYASALAVMGRTLDIPTRYVEGFVTSEDMDEQGRYIVTGKQAHAWTEVYFPAFGWVKFEPTSSYSEDSPAPVPEEIPDTEPEPEPIQPEQPDIQEQDDVPKPPQNSNGDNSNEPESNASPILPAVIAVLLILGLSALFVYTMAGIYKKRADRVKALDNRDSVQLYFGRILHVASILGEPIEYNETALTYASRTKDSAIFKESGVDIQELAAIMSVAAYSEHHITDDERKLMAKSFRNMQDAVKNQSFLKRIAFYFYVLMKL